MVILPHDLILNPVFNIISPRREGAISTLSMILFIGAAKRLHARARMEHIVCN